MFYKQPLVIRVITHISDAGVQSTADEKIKIVVTFKNSLKLSLGLKLNTSTCSCCNSTKKTTILVKILHWRSVGRTVLGALISHIPVQ